MGVTYGVMCMDCGDEAPELGDFGYLGYPSLDQEKGKKYVPNFGYIYKGFRTLGLLTPGVEELREFLEKHRGHAMDLSCEGEPMFEEDDAEEDSDEGSGDEDDLDDEADEDEDPGDDELEDEDFDEDEDEEEEEEGDEDDKPAARSRSKSALKFVEAQYTAVCSKCKASHVTSQADQVLPFEPRTLTPAEAKDAWPRIAGDEFYDRGAEPFYDELPGISAFLKKHGAHSVTVSLKAK